MEELDGTCLTQRSIFSHCPGGFCLRKDAVGGGQIGLWWQSHPVWGCCGNREVGQATSGRDGKGSPSPLLPVHQCGHNSLRSLVISAALMQQLPRESPAGSAMLIGAWVGLLSSIHRLPIYPPIHPSTHPPLPSFPLPSFPHVGWVPPVDRCRRGALGVDKILVGVLPF